VSANGHPTEKISEFIDFHLRPFIANLPSHIKDTTDYLKKMENLTIAENTTLVTMMDGYCWHVRKIHQALYRNVSTSCQRHL
jgi:hypothetical protein